jgi:hypothetical protein
MYFSGLMREVISDYVKLEMDTEAWVENRSLEISE